jgi:hypothetical protein
LNLVKRILSVYNKWYFDHGKDRRGTTRLKKGLENISAIGVEKVNEDTARGVQELDWEILIIIDACRHDLFEQSQGDTDYRVSLGSCTQDFIMKNWDGDHNDIVYVTGNPMFNRSKMEELVGEENPFFEMFRTYEENWDNEERTCLPKEVAEDAKTANKMFPDKKLVVHFIQPHYPFINFDFGLNAGDAEAFIQHEGRDVWELASMGEISDDELWSGYKHNLSVVMEEVENLNEAFDRTIVLTSDHANMVGEANLYGHPCEKSWEKLRRVPLKRYS